MLRQKCAYKNDVETCKKSKSKKKEKLLNIVCNLAKTNKR